MVLILDGNLYKGARVRSNLLFDLFKAFDKIESIHNSDFVFSKKTYLPSCVRNMF